MRPTRVRTVHGSCWSCKKRRVKCDLTKPVCQRCALIGATCNYSAVLIRWSHQRTNGRHSAKLPSPADGKQLSTCLEAGERRALDYFDCRVWPLLSTSSSPGVSPVELALEHRPVLLAICVLADAHKLLQEGRSNTHGLTTKRADCLAAVRTEVGACYFSDRTSLSALLVAVLLLYFNDGYLECDGEHASTMSHHSGALAILEQMGGLHDVLQTGLRPLQMMISEFVTNDLTTALLLGKAPSWPPSVWEVIDEGHVWWGRDPLGMSSLASVFRQMSAMAWHLHAAPDKTSPGGLLSMDQVRAFEKVLAPTYAPLLASSQQDDVVTRTIDPKARNGAATSKLDAEAVHAFTLVRIFQHTALIILYRAVCALPALHPTVQQHVRSCLDCIFEVERPSKVLNCITFPLLVAGAHTKSAKYQAAALNMARIVYDDMRFTALRSVASALEAIWASELQNKPWVELFSQLNCQTLPL